MHKINFMKLRNVFFLLSIVIIGVSLLFVFIKGFNQGIDFTGGLTANLSINFEKSDIKKLRGLFSAVEFTKKVKDSKSAVKLTKKNEDSKSVVVKYNMGKNISELKDNKKKSYLSKTYLIRVKKMPGMSEKQIEHVLMSILHKNFKEKKIVSFALKSSKDYSVAIVQDSLKQLGQFKINKSIVKTKVDNKTVLSYKYDVIQNVKKGGSDKKLRTAVIKTILNDKRFELAKEIKFVSTIDWGYFNAVSATIGQELRDDAVLLAVMVILVILFYVALRFNYKFGIASIGALVHDLLITLGLISFLGIEMNVPVIAALLTIFGYSINDTIVIFDRIRENLGFSRKEDLPEILNKSINQSMSRTIVTSLTTLLAVLSIYFFAGEVLRSFAIIMIFGIFIGTYSSIYIASPLYLLVEKLTGAKELKSSESKS